MAATVALVGGGRRRLVHGAQPAAVRRAGRRGGGRPAAGEGRLARDGPGAGARARRHALGAGGRARRARGRRRGRDLGRDPAHREHVANDLPGRQRGDPRADRRGAAARLARLRGGRDQPGRPLVTWFQRETGLARDRVLGYTLNDSLRLRTGIAEALGAGAGEVEAWVLGEHGDAAVPLFSRVRVRGRRVELEPAARTAADAFVRTWYRRHVALDSGRSSTWTSGLGMARLVEELVRGREQLTVASTVLAGEYGIEDVAVGVPVRLGRDGARVQEWPLAAAEHEALRAAAAIVRGATLSLRR